MFGCKSEFILWNRGGNKMSFMDAGFFALPYSAYIFSSEASIVLSIQKIHKFFVGKELFCKARMCMQVNDKSHLLFDSHNNMQMTNYSYIENYEKTFHYL